MTRTPVRGSRSAWLAGLTVGAGAGFLALELPVLGWLIAIAFLAGGLVSRRLLAAGAGLLVGSGLTWTTLIGRVALTCRERCWAPGIEPWLIVGGSLLATGLALSLVAAWRQRR
jgi:hypothetical protein